MEIQQAMKINEIFYSLQGEGKWSGTPMIFIRFSGCNLKCSFCDTDHADAKEMSTADILAAVNQYRTRHVCLTGGEPSLFVTQELIDMLHQQGRFIHIETNGTHELPEGVDWVTVSPKTETIALKAADEIKIVYQGQEVKKWLAFPAKYHYLQPCSCENTAEVINYIKSNPEWKLSVQMHKLLNLR